jgi:hypothetical protein
MCRDAKIMFSKLFSTGSQVHSQEPTIKGEDYKCYKVYTLFLLYMKDFAFGTM